MSQQFVRFDCGCIGFAPTSEHDAETATVVKICDDRDGTPYGAGTRNMRGKSWEPESPEANEIHWRNIARLIFNGYTYRDIARALQTSTANQHDEEIPRDLR